MRNACSNLFFGHGWFWSGMVCVLASSQCASLWADAVSEETSSPQTPEVRIEHTTVDLGNVPFNEPFSHAFEITNSGTSPLRVRVGHKSCSCTTSLVSAEFVSPGDSLTFELGFVPRLNSKQTGTRTVTATLETNDPNRKQILFRVVAKQVGPIESSVMFLDFGEVPIGAVSKQEFEIVLRPYRGKMPVLDAITTSFSELQVVELSQKHKDGANTIRLQAVLDHSSPNSDTASWIRLRTDSDAVPSLEIPIRVKTHFDIQSTLVNNTVVFGVILPGEHITKEVELKTVLKGAPDTMELSSSSPFLRVEHLPKQDDKPPMLKLTLVGGDTLGPFSGYVDFLETNEKIAGRVFVRALVRKQKR